MTPDWTSLDAALERRPPVLWWRDDDATEPSPALDRLLALTASVGAPLTVAAIPAQATEALARRLAPEPAVSVAVHGWAHANHAPPHEKTAEFGPHRPLRERVGQAERGLRLVGETFGKRALAVFVPPWNRLAPDMPDALARLDYRGVSVYGERMPRRAPLPRFDAHIDPIDWRGTRSAVDPARLAMHLRGLLEEDAPIGLMTHHLAHDEPVWNMVGSLVAHLTARGARWAALPGLIGTPPDLFTN